MRNVSLFRLEPKSRSEDWSPTRALSFAADPRSLPEDPSSDIMMVSIPADRFSSLRTAGSDGYIVPAAMARSAQVADAGQVETFCVMQDAYDKACQVRRSMVLERMDCVLPGEMSPVARILWRHVPEAAARVGVFVPGDEGGDILQHMGRDIERARPTASYLSCREDAEFLKEVCDGVSPTSITMREISDQAMHSDNEHSRSVSVAPQTAAFQMAQRMAYQRAG